MKVKIKKGPLIDLLLCFGVAALFLLFLSKNSPLYPMNDWVDVHCFFTMGKGILHGDVPYRDLYDQKGPVLYFLYALAALIQQNGFFGVFLLEAAALGAFLYFSLELLRLYLPESPWLYASLPVLISAACLSPAYSHGGSVETLSLWILSYSLLTVLRSIRQERLLTGRESFCIGLGTAAVVYMKFTIAGFQLGLALFTVIWYLFFARKPVELGKTIGRFFAGFAAVSLPVFLYFLVCGALGDFLTGYFYNNLFLYSEAAESRLQLIFTGMENAYFYNTSWGALVALGIVWALLRCPRRKEEGLAVLLSFIGLAVGTYWGGRLYSYYALILTAFAPLGLAALGGVLQWDNPPRPTTSKSKTQTVPIVCLLLLTVLLLNHARSSGRNVYLLGEDRASMPQYQFAETINSLENPTLLNFGFLDGGFYHAARVTPSCRYFCTLNIPLTDMWPSQREAIQSGAVDFVITRQHELDYYQREDCPDFGGNYTLVQAASHYFEGTDFTYYLYQRTDTLVS